MSSGMRDAYGGRMFGAQKGHAGPDPDRNEPPLIVTRLRYGADHDGIKNISADDCRIVLAMLAPDTEAPEEGDDGDE